MNQEKFEDTLRELISRASVDLQFVTSWFEKTLDQLSSLKEQQRAIKHPRDRGDAREGNFAKIFRGILPKSVDFLRGYAINEYATKSHEQDCLLLDKNRAAAFISIEPTTYYPIEAILGAVQIKSKLTLSELRDLIVNCVSLKRLAYNRGFSKDYTEKPKVRLAYFVFAYGAVWDLKETCARVNTLVKAVPHPLRPNMFYILREGFLLPRHTSGGFLTGPDQMFAATEFGFQGKMGTKYLPKSDAMPFLWFLSNIIDYCLMEIDQRKAPWYGKYVLAPHIVQSVMEQNLAKERPNSET